MKSFIVKAALCFSIAAFCSAQPSGHRPGKFAGGPEAPVPPYIVTHIPSEAGGDTGIAVGVLPPLKPRYAEGAPVVIEVPGGANLGAAEGPSDYAGMGFVEILFAFPGGGRGKGISGGAYDQRGPHCVRALADVIRFATGRLADTQGRTIQDLVPQFPVLTANAGIVGSSHGGNACGRVMAVHGGEFPDLAFYASMESPYGEGNVNIELGGRDQGVNPAYHAETGVLDLSKLAWANELTPGPPQRWRNEKRGVGADLKGALYFDLNGDGTFTEANDFLANTFVQDLGQGPKTWYSPRLIREAESRKLFGDTRPAHIPSLSESTEYWQWRDASGSISEAVKQCPNAAVIVYANERDHVQVAPDHPHILTQEEGFRNAGCKFVRLNPDKSYVERILQNGPIGRKKPVLHFPDNDAGMAWDRTNIRTGLEPEALPIRLYMQAAVAELADRTQSKNWSKNLDAILYADAPYEAVAPMRRDRRSKGDVSPPPPPTPPEEKAQPEPQPQSSSLQQHVAPDAGSPEAPLLFCIGVHVEPFGATVSKLVTGQEQDVPAFLPGKGPLGANPAPNYENGPLFQRHIADVKTLAEIVERHAGKLTVQAQTPFSRLLVQSGDTLIGDLAKRGHEIALHFHENMHLGPNDIALPPETWAAVMGEEMEWLKKAGAGKVRYWSGGNLYPGVLEAASRAGLDVMSDYKNPHTQQDDPSLLAVTPWRPAVGPSETDLSGFATHDPKGKIVYLPNGVFERVDHSAMRRSAETGGDYGYFDALTKSVELSLRAAQPNRTNVFHVTVHPGEFRGGPRTERPFAVLDDWLAKVIDPLVKAGKVRWATFSEMTDAYAQWEQNNPGTPPRAASAPETPAQERANITFVVNVHDFGRADKSAATIARLMDIFTTYKVKGDFYLTAPVLEAYAEKHPEIIQRLRDTGMTVSYHFRPPHPAYSGYDARLRDLDDAALRSALEDCERYRLDLATGEVQRDRPGGYAYVKEVFGGAPVCVSALSNPRVKSMLLDIYREQGAQMTMEYHESGTDPDQPFVWKQGLLIRPSDFSVTRWTVPGEREESFWWSRLDSPRADEFNPTAYLRQRLSEWQHPRKPLITAIIHENDFYVSGGPSWQYIYRRGDRKSHTPPYDLNAPDESEPRPQENQDAIWRAYEELVQYAAAHLNVVTSADIVKMAAGYL